MIFVIAKNFAINQISNKNVTEEIENGESQDDPEMSSDQKSEEYQTKYKWALEIPKLDLYARYRRGNRR